MKITTDDRETIIMILCILLCTFIRYCDGLKAGIAEPERKFIASQRLAKHTFPQQRTSPLLANGSVSTSA
jgi:hypothetical protein